MGNVTNESKATMFTSPTFTGNVALGTNATGTFNGSLGSTGFPFTSGYLNLGAYRFKYGTGSSPVNDTGSFESGDAGTVYYSVDGLEVSLTGFASVVGVVATIESNFVDVYITSYDASTSSVHIRPASARGNDAWNGKTISYLIWGTPS